MERQHTQQRVDHCQPETVPLHRRVALRIACIEEFAVFNKQQRLQHDRWDIVKRAIDVRRDSGTVYYVAGLIEEAEASLHLLVVHRRETTIDHLGQLGGDTGLGDNDKAERT